MTEIVFNFGSDNELSGILTLPESGIEKRHAPSIIFLNPGFLHKTGFNRFHTDLARHLSLSGYSSLRFDLHGLGDSGSCNPAVDYDNQVISDIQQAIDLVTKKRETRESVLFGLCSGADYAHAAATKDNRITGLVLLDAYAYRTLGFVIRDYGPIVVNPFRISRFVIRSIGKAFSPSKSGIQEPVRRQIYSRPFPQKKQIIRDLRSFIGRGVKLFYIYSGGVPGYYNYANQFFDMFRPVDFKGLVSHKYVKDADHTYTITAIREKLKKNISEWINRNYP